jgi:hypothetical protein
MDLWRVDKNFFHTPGHQANSTHVIHIPFYSYALLALTIVRTAGSSIIVDRCGQFPVLIFIGQRDIDYPCRRGGEAN